MRCEWEFFPHGPCGPVLSEPGVSGFEWPSARSCGARIRTIGLCLGRRDLSLTGGFWLITLPGHFFLYAFRRPLVHRHWIRR